MGKLYGSSIELSLTISPTQEAPLDDRLAVATYDDLAYLKAYKGLIVYVEDENSYYTYVKDADENFYWKKGLASSSQYGDDGTTIISALRALQAEVVKMRNSFFYGLNSYTEKDTNPSVTLGEYDDDGVSDEEPLWAVSEDDLSEAYTMSLDSLHDLVPVENVDISKANVLTISGTTEVSLTKFTQNITDSKLFIYLTTSGQDVKVKLKDLNTNEIVTINLKDLNLSQTIYNYLVVISRKLETAGKQFISIVADNRSTGETLAEGYWNRSELQDAFYNLKADYTLQSIQFTDLDLYKCNVYYRYQDFNDNIVPTTYKPSDEKYKYKVAHLTIRSVAEFATLDEIKTSLQENELIFCEETAALYVKSKNTIIKIGASSGSDVDPDTPTTDTMTKDDVLEILTDVGLVLNDDNSLSLSNIADITFISENGNKYLVAVDANGNLVTKQIIEDTVYNSIKNLYVSGSSNAVTEGTSNRGFIGRLGMQNAKKAGEDTIYNSATNLGLYSDRVRIGAYYAPLASDKVFGCSHCYIELENTSETDLPLNDFYLHYCYPKLKADGTYEQTVETLALEGILKGGSTFVVRGAKMKISANTFINVTYYDQEWRDSDGNLIDFTLDTTVGSEYGWAFAITYCDAQMIEDAKENTISTPYIKPDTVLSTNLTTYYGGYIDSIYIFRGWTGASWCPGSTLPAPISNCITRNTFELDPANQAYRALNTLDSNTQRWKNNKEYMYVQLNNDVIEFPGSDAQYPVTLFAPKGNKNVCTDKTQLDLEKPNAVTVSFGKNIHTTRCFNWVSGGLFDEYVWIRKQGDTTWSNKFASYNEKTVSTPTAIGTNSDTVTYTESTALYSKTPMSRVEFGYKHSASKTTITTDTTTGKSTSTTTALATNEHVDTKGIYKAIYNRITNVFPATGDIYTTHKCIVYVQDETSEGAPIVYEYIVGRADKSGQPRTDHCSDIQTFTVYPNTYKPRVYQVTDQQGFYWIEYQPWAAAAEVLNKQINEETAAENIMPILINTGDMTQNGTRVNEWLDYYNAGKSLFNHLEQMNVVGNNDLCRSDDPTILGTGDDSGKSSPYYFTIFYCYEIDEENIDGTDVTPIINGVYIPSLYYFGNSQYMYLMVNSELTEETCRTYFNITTGTKFYNAYTGWMIPNTETDTYPTDLTWTPIYNKLYAIINANKDKFIIAACHEMPFTVITRASLATSQANVFRNLSEKGALVGSHMNQISTNDNCHGVFWFSRLLEHFNIKLCIGGHKHTYSVTYPVRERYIINGVDNYLANTAVDLGFVDGTTYYVYDSTQGGYVATTDAAPVAGTVYYTPAEAPLVYSFDSDTKYYVMDGDSYILTTDATPVVGETYYTVNNVDITSFTEGMKYYVKDATEDKYILTTDTEVMAGTTYYLVNVVYLYKFNASITYHVYDEANKIYKVTTDATPSPGGTYYTINMYGEKTYPKMEMSKDLSNDLLTLNTGVRLHTLAADAATNSNVNLSKFPIVSRSSYNTTSDVAIFSPCSPTFSTANNIGGVYYFMCQATGFKLTSNKELPWTGQAFSEILPTTVIKSGADSAAGDQQYPMYAVIHLDGTSVKVELIRLHNILSDAKHTFTQQGYGNGKVEKYYLHKTAKKPTGVWETYIENNYILTIS